MQPPALSLNYRYELPGRRLLEIIKHTAKGSLQMVGTTLETSAGPTFPSDGPRERIDYFWYDAARLRPVRTRIPDTQASDHRPLVATFRLGGEPTRK